MTRLTIAVLGGLSIQLDGAEARSDLPTRKAKAILAYLALSPGMLRSREHLAGTFWDRSAEEQARASLRQTLSSVRRTVSSTHALINTDSDSVWLDTQAVHVDALQFERLTQERSVESLEQAVALYRGELLGGFSLREEGFEQWMSVERRRLHELAVQAFSELVDQYTRADRIDRGIAVAERLLVLDPLLESTHRSLIGLYLRSGRREAAARQFQACVRILNQELGIAPADETRRLAAEVNREPASTTAQLTGATTSYAVDLKQEVHFCSAPDGVQLAYAKLGHGLPLVKTGNWMTHLEYDLESPIWRHLYRELAKIRTLIRYDARGNGLSDRTAHDISFDAFVSDLETVVDAAGVERFALLGISQGCSVAVAYAVRHAERVSHLILYGGYALGRNKRARSAAEREENSAMLTLARLGWGKENPAFRQLFTSQFMPGATKEQADWFNELQRMTVTPELAVRFLEAVGEIDVTALLPQVRVPTLVMHARDDARIPFDAGRQLAAAIPDAQFVMLQGRNHLFLETEPAFRQFLEHTWSFLAR